MNPDDIDLERVLALLRLIFLEMRPERRASAQRELDEVASHYPRVGT